MNKIDRRDFLLGAASLAVFPIVSAVEAAGAPGYRFLLPENDNTYEVGKTVALRVFTRTAYPRLTVNFRVNGQLIGTATRFPYQVNWTPAQNGDYSLVAEISAPRTSIALIATAKVYNYLLYDGIGRRGSQLYRVDGSYSSFVTTYFPETIYGVPLNFTSTLAAPRIIRRIEAILSATTNINNTTENLTFPTNFNYVQARLWNDGANGFQNSPRSGNLSNTNIGAPNFGSTSVPVAVSSNGIKYYATGWTNLNIALPSSNPLGLSIQFAINSPYDFAERINFAQSNISGQNLLYAAGQASAPPNIFNIGASAIRIWAD